MTNYDFESVLLPRRRTHGGKRPGAGAKPGNTNALKHGHYSTRFFKAALMMAAVPELRVLLRALQAEASSAGRDRLRQIFAAAMYAADNDAELAESIKQLVYARLRDATAQIRNRTLILQMLDNNQTIKTQRRSSASG